MTRYDTIGTTYAATRRPDPRFARRITAALGDARRVVNVGAGTGNYEPDDRLVIAVDPSATMLAQRPSGASPAVMAAAEALPFADEAFDAALAILTLHHWDDLEARSRRGSPGRPAPGRLLLRTVVRRCPLVGHRLLPRDAGVGVGAGCARARPPARAPRRHRGRDPPGAVRLLRRVRRLLLESPGGVPRSDGAGGHVVLGPARAPDPPTAAPNTSVATSPTGTWDARHGHLRALAEIDIGYRLLVAGPLS